MKTKKTMNDITKQAESLLKNDPEPENGWVVIDNDLLRALLAELEVSRRDYEVMYKLHNGLESELEAVNRVVIAASLFERELIDSGEDVDPSYDFVEVFLNTLSTHKRGSDSE